MNNQLLTPSGAPVLIVGGGLAGLYAAYRLQQANIPYVLWEAQPRWGGRILSLLDPTDSSMGMDLGPTWFWPHQTRMQGLCAELGLRVFEQPVKGDLLYQVAPGQAPQRSAGAGTMLSYRLEGGMQTLISALVRRIKPQALNLSHALTSLSRDESGWTATAFHQGEALHFQAQQLIVAAPPRKVAGLLAPFLPRRLQGELLATPTWMAAQAKFIAIYDTPFWRNEGLAGQAFSRVGPLVEIHDASSTPRGGHALFGFVGVPAHLRRQHDHASIEAACLAQLTTIFGPAASLPLAISLKDWAQDEWVVSDRDLFEPPQHPALNLAPWSAELRRLGLHLVGSEYAENEAGYLEGALCAVESFLDAAIDGNSTKLITLKRNAQTA
ncbi:FAD-dependent oxidoreductase [Rhodoferax sp. PAMC 29310]|uniref:flavin monoamine oxidase family protein n=1 Tax=Rhodoferax sp. PAMC 29310 TaxID=2822760 RepID=UPI001B345175|nr:FAD-dependent oxidoreductase [Rhodoferax sp. PAMC 29310]